MRWRCQEMEAVDRGQKTNFTANSDQKIWSYHWSWHLGGAGMKKHRREAARWACQLKKDVGQGLLLPEPRESLLWLKKWHCRSWSVLAGKGDNNPGSNELQVPSKGQVSLATWLYGGLRRALAIVYPSLPAIPGQTVQDLSWELKARTKAHWSQGKSSRGIQWALDKAFDSFQKEKEKWKLFIFSFWMCLFPLLASVWFKCKLRK